MSDDHRDRLQTMFNDRAPIVRTFGMRLSFADQQAVVEMEYNPALDHAGSGVHGGVLMTMLDNAAGFTAAALRRRDAG